MGSTTRTSSESPANVGDSYYDGAIADLQRTVDAGRAPLEPETVRILEENLRAVDAAIEETRRALSADPGNVYLNSHLAEAREVKLLLLRGASRLAAGRDEEKDR